MTKYIKREEINDNIILEVANALKKGRLVVFPTDTVYGIGTNAFNVKSCEKIYEVKKRDKCKPLIVLIADISMLKNLVENISPLEQKLINAFWPGPLTILFKKKNGVFPEIISSVNEYIGIRWINKGILSKLIQLSGIPIVAPSANLSESFTGTKMKNIINELEGKVDYILDYGDIKDDSVSTIVQVKEEKIVVIRRGKITNEELEKIMPLNKM